MRLVLPGPAGQSQTYFVRVYSSLGMGSIAGSDLADGETFKITDGSGKAVTFEFDTGNGVHLGNVAVSFAQTNSAGSHRGRRLPTPSTVWLASAAELKCRPMAQLRFVA